jgi:hypothetical protein
MLKRQDAALSSPSAIAKKSLRNRKHETICCSQTGQKSALNDVKCKLHLDLENQPPVHDRTNCQGR